MKSPWRGPILSLLSVRSFKGRRQFGLTPRSWFRGGSIFNGAAFLYFLQVYPRPAPMLSVHFKGGRVKILLRSGFDCQVSTGKMEHDSLERGSVQGEATNSRDHRIHTYASKDIPGAHGSHVVISRYSALSNKIQLIQNPADRPGCFVRSSDPVVNPRNLETWLIASSEPVFER